jgi:hypothetical protein
VAKAGTGAARLAGRAAPGAGWSAGTTQSDGRDNVAIAENLVRAAQDWFTDLGLLGPYRLREADVEVDRLDLVGAGGNHVDQKRY